MPLVQIIALDAGWQVMGDLIPESLSESKSAAYDQQTIRGRSVPVYGYSHSETRTVDLSMVLPAIEGGGVSANTSPNLSSGAEIVDTVKKLKSAVYPRYQGLIYPPTRVSLTVGMFLHVPTAVITSISITWGDSYDESGYPLSAEVSLTFEEVEDIPSSEEEVRA